MAGEVQARNVTGRTLFYTVHNQTSGFVWNLSGGSTGAFEAFVSGNYSNYGVGMTEEGVSAFYRGNFPSTIPPGIYSIDIRNQAGASPAQTDAGVAAGDLQWDGVINVPLVNLATSGQVAQFAPIRLARGVQILNWPIYFKSSVDHVTGFTSGVVSGQIARDGGSFGALQSGAFTEQGFGWFTVQALTSGDLLANTARLHFTAVGISGGSADPVPIGLVLQRVSGV